MTIIYSPRNLEHVLNHPFAGNILKNREGCVQELQPNGRGVCLGGGSILEVYQLARRRDRERPEGSFLVSEDRCGGNCPLEFR